jgi:hypothetical protein
MSSLSDKKIASRVTKQHGFLAQISYETLRTRSISLAQSETQNWLRYLTRPKRAGFADLENEPLLFAGIGFGSAVQLQFSSCWVA